MRMRTSPFGGGSRGRKDDTKDEDEIEDEAQNENENEDEAHITSQKKGS